MKIASSAYPSSDHTCGCCCLGCIVTPTLTTLGGYFGYELAGGAGACLGACLGVLVSKYLMDIEFDDSTKIKKFEALKHHALEKNQYGKISIADEKEYFYIVNIDQDQDFSLDFENEILKKSNISYRPDSINHLSLDLILNSTNKKSLEVEQSQLGERKVEEYIYEFSFGYESEGPRISIIQKQNNNPNKFIHFGQMISTVTESKAKSGFF